MFCLELLLFAQTALSMNMPLDRPSLDQPIPLQAERMPIGPILVRTAWSLVRGCRPQVDLLGQRDSACTRI